ncbi:MAG: mannose/fructose/sorbose PTS transporter subunit IIA [Clostridiaceae bacterium]
MIGIIVATHGKFSKEIIGSAEMIFGKQENVISVTFEPGESADGLVDKYKEAMKELKYEDGLLFFVDLFGGSPYNAASRIVMEEENMDIVTGVSLPMLLEAFGSKDIVALPELVEIAMNSARDAVKSFKASFSDVEEEEL